MMRGILKSFVTCRSSLLLRNNTPVLQQKVCLSKSVEEKLGLPSKPKRPLSPFFRFMAQVRPIIKKKNPDAKPKDIVKSVSEQWKQVNEDTKTKLAEDYKAEILIYLAEVEKYNEHLSDEQREQIKSAKEKRVQAKKSREYKKKVEELGKPKKPPSAYILFLRKKMEEKGSDEKFIEFCKVVAKEWKTLPENEKDRYLNEAKQQHEAYDRELRAWREKMMLSGNIDVIDAPSKSRAPRSSPKSSDSLSVEVPAKSHSSPRSRSSKSQSKTPPANSGGKK